MSPRDVLIWLAACALVTVLAALLLFGAAIAPSAWECLRPGGDEKGCAVGRDLLTMSVVFAFLAAVALWACIRAILRRAEAAGPASV